jgi:hypothetical protein
MSHGIAVDHITSCNIISYLRSTIFQRAERAEGLSIGLGLTLHSHSISHPFAFPCPPFLSVTLCSSRYPDSTPLLLFSSLLSSVSFTFSLASFFHSAFLVFVFFSTVSSSIRIPYILISQHHHNSIIETSLDAIKRYFKSFLHATQFIET